MNDDKGYVRLRNSENSFLFLEVSYYNRSIGIRIYKDMLELGNYFMREYEVIQED